MPRHKHRKKRRRITCAFVCTRLILPAVLLLLLLRRLPLGDPTTANENEKDAALRREIQARDATIVAQEAQIVANDAELATLRVGLRAAAVAAAAAAAAAPAAVAPPAAPPAEPQIQNPAAATTTATAAASAKDSNNSINYDVHAFYYGWYGSPAFDPDKAGWVHWNHPFLEHWDRAVASRYPGKDRRHDPSRGDLGSDFWPQLGPYASASPAVLRQHVNWAAAAGVGVLVLSWYPPGKADENGRPSDPLVAPLLNACHEKGVKVALHVEPYKGRSADSVRDDLAYAVGKYGSHPAFHRMHRRTGEALASATTTTASATPTPTPTAATPAVANVLK